MPGAMNGPIKMYQIRQIVRHDLPVELPDCMYKLKNIQAGSVAKNGITADTTKLDTFQQNNFTSDDMAALEARQERVLLQLEQLKVDMQTIRDSLNSIGTTKQTSLQCDIKKITKNSTASVQNIPDLVINVSPNNPPYSLLLLKNLWSHGVTFQTFKHSSISTLPDAARKLSEDLENCQTTSVTSQINVRLIWKDVGVNQLEFMLKQTPILGECNLLRYIARATSSLNYDETNYEIDTVLDLCHSICRSRTKTETSQLIQLINKRLGKNDFLFGSNLNIADLAAYSAIKQTGVEVNANLSKWMERCEKATL